MIVIYLICYTNMPLFFIVTANLIIMASTMFISYIILTVRLKQTKSSIKTAQSDRVNSKVTKVCWIMVTLWLILSLPLVILAQVMTKIPYTNFVGTFHDVTFLIYCLSNIAPYFVCYHNEGFQRRLQSIVFVHKSSNQE